ncbi:MAG TPA: VWA domain-containing protein [Terriglobales bacterium]|nr:VWA domain-containing protein [Terriglobales bacterium]
MARKRGYGRGSCSRVTAVRGVRWADCAGLLLLLFLFSLSALAQSSTDDVHVVPHTSAPANTVPGMNLALKTHTKPMKVDVDLVLVPVTVTDPMNRLVTGLDKENFEVYDGKEKELIKHFSSEDAPISLGVIFDHSGSMTDKIDKAKQAVIEFFKTANPQDEFFMVAFSERPELVSDFTKSVETIQGRMIYTLPQGRTALLDAIYMGIEKMHEARNSRKALLIISDGGDNRSRYTDTEIRDVVREADVQIYAIGIFEPNPPTEEERYGPILLDQITSETGGRLFRLYDVNELEDVASKIGIELRNQYVIGYHPGAAPRDGKWHKIKVKLLPPKGLPPLHVYAKTGYYAPSQ